MKKRYQEEIKIKNKNYKEIFIVLLALIVLFVAVVILYYYLGENKDKANDKIKEGGEVDKGAVNEEETSFNDNYVTEVIDGDTVKLYNKDIVRLIGIDTPEKGKKCFDEAKEMLERFVLNKEVILEKDKTDKDAYGRILRYVYAEVNEDEIMMMDKSLDKVNYIKTFNNRIYANANIFLVSEGFAKPFSYGNDILYESELKAAEKYAKDNKNGCLWE